MTLYARWEEITSPTYIIVSIMDDDTEITLNYTQTNANGLEID